VEYRPKTNAEILWDTGHVKGHTQEGKGKERKLVTWMLLICSLYNNEHKNLKLAGAIRERELERSEED
jgi:hypothetical protein